MGGGQGSRRDWRIAGLLAALVDGVLVLVVLATAAALWTIAAVIAHVVFDRDWGAAFSATVPALVSGLFVLVLEERRRRRRSGTRK
ncbi:hypothetical protein [Kineococcus arenarius]|uniref:hypothetical protein n=1 Tax=Kineococcus sp. SYSU DK007 TaxID=3383128 RepID=UPI003D7D408D